MILVLVTDRARLGTAIGARPEAWTDVLRTQVRAAAAAGVDYIHVREGDLEARALADLVRSLLETTQKTAARLLVNDRVDVALATGADGVHLKEQSVLPDQVRRIAPEGFVIGCSVHTTAAVAARKAADFLTAGTVLPTASKSAPDYLDEDGLRRIVRAAGAQPVIGIGGMDVGSIPLLATSGAAGLAAIGAFIPTGGTDVSEFVQKRVQQLRFALDRTPDRT
jgi:thiamine-phosphate pyrophosphorylase